MPVTPHSANANDREQHAALRAEAARHHAAQLIVAAPQNFLDIG